MDMRLRALRQQCEEALLALDDLCIHMPEDLLEYELEDELEDEQVILRGGPAGDGPWNQ